MPYHDFNRDGVTADNLEDFVEAIVSFHERKGYIAANRWLFKLNPEAARHVDLEMSSCGDGYTPSMARAVVFGEFSNQPLPIHCPECGDVMWYRATALLMKCQGCGATDAEHPDRRYLQ